MTRNHHHPLSDGLPTPTRPIPDLRLPEHKRKALLEKASQFQPPFGPERNRALVEQARLLSDELTPLAPFLAEMGLPDGPVFWVISNLPIDPELPAPPTDGKRPLNKKTWVSELDLLAVARAASLTPLSYVQERGEVLVHEIAPNPAKAGTSNSLSNRVLDLHTDNALLQRAYRPEVLMLLSLTNSNSTPTLIALLDDALCHLQTFSPAALEILQSPRYWVRAPYAFNLGEGKTLYSAPRPLLYRNASGQWEIAGNLSTVEPTDRDASIALAILRSTCEQIAQPIVLEPGMMLIFNNHRCVHGRPAIQGDRWLQRLYGRWSLNAIRRATGTSPDQFVFDIRGLLLE